MMISQAYVWMLAEIYLKQSEGAAEADKPDCEVSEPETLIQDKNKREDNRACNKDSIVKQG